MAANTAYCVFCGRHAPLPFVHSIECNVVMCGLSGRITSSCHFMAIVGSPSIVSSVESGTVVYVQLSRYEERAVSSPGDTAGFSLTCYTINFLLHTRYFAVFLIATFKYSRRASLNRTNCMKLLHLLPATLVSDVACYWRNTVINIIGAQKVTYTYTCTYYNYIYRKNEPVCVLFSLLLYSCCLSE